MIMYCMLEDVSQFQCVIVQRHIGGSCTYIKKILDDTFSWPIFSFLHCRYFGIYLCFNNFNLCDRIDKDQILNVNVYSSIIDLTKYYSNIMSMFYEFHDLQAEPNVVPKNINA